MAFRTGDMRLKRIQPDGSVKVVFLVPHTERPSGIMQHYNAVQSGKAPCSFDGTYGSCALCDQFIENAVIRVLGGNFA